MHIIAMPLLLRANVICWERQTLELNIFLFTSIPEHVKYSCMCELFELRR